MRVPYLSALAQIYTRNKDRPYAAAFHPPEDDGNKHVNMGANKRRKVLTPSVVWNEKIPK